MPFTPLKHTGDQHNHDDVAAIKASAMATCHSVACPDGSCSNSIREGVAMSRSCSPCVCTAHTLSAWAPADDDEVPKPPPEPLVGLIIAATRLTLGVFAPLGADEPPVDEMRASFEVLTGGGSGARLLDDGAGCESACDAWCAVAVGGGRAGASAATVETPAPIDSWDMAPLRSTLLRRRPAAIGVDTDAAERSVSPPPEEAEGLRGTAVVALAAAGATGGMDRRPALGDAAVVARGGSVEGTEDDEAAEAAAGRSDHAARRDRFDGTQ